MKHQHRTFKCRVEAKLFGGSTLVVHTQANGAGDVVETACGLGVELGWDEGNSLMEGTGSLSYADVVDVV